MLKWLLMTTPIYLWRYRETDSGEKQLQVGNGESQQLCLVFDHLEPIAAHRYINSFDAQDTVLMWLTQMQPDHWFTLCMSLACERTLHIAMILNNLTLPVYSRGPRTEATKNNSIMTKSSSPAWKTRGTTLLKLCVVPPMPKKTATANQPECHGRRSRTQRSDLTVTSSIWRTVAE